MNRPWRAKFAAIASVWALTSWVSSSTSATGTDYFSQRIPRPLVSAPDRVVPQHAYLRDAPAYWPQPVHWRYNPADAPGDLGESGDAALQQIINASAAWTAVCGVQIVYDGATSSSPGMLTGGHADLVNVIGWRAPASGVMAETQFWVDSDAQSDDIIVDADILLDPTTADDSPATGVRHHA